MTMGNDIASPAAGGLASTSRENTFSRLWPSPKFAPKPAFSPSRAGRHWQRSPTAAVELELRRARALRRLRGLLNEACGKESSSKKQKKMKDKRKKKSKEEDAGAEDEDEEEEEEEEEEAEEERGEKKGAASAPSSPVIRLGIGAAPLLAFERWMWACSAPAAAADPGSSSSSAAAADPVVPRPSLPFEPGLARALVRAGAGRAASEAVSSLLSAESRRLSAAIAKEARARASSSGGSGGGGGGGKKEERDAVAVAVHKHSLDLCAATSPSPSPSSPSSPSSFSSSAKEFIKISRPAYCRLLRAFRECGPEAERPPELAAASAAAAAADDDAEVAAAAGASSSRSAFHSRLFAMLLRYKSLAGPGFHASVGGPVCTVLAKTLGTGLEGFASPVNARWARFGCAFADVDAVFGGLGSFFSAADDEKKGDGGGSSLSANRLLLPAGGAVLVNPPFEPGTLLAAARCCVRAVEEASRKGTRLSVVFVGPRWGGKKGGAGAADEGGDGAPEEDDPSSSSNDAYLSVLSSSSSSSNCLEHSFTVAAAEHGYRDGAPHAARDPYRRSPFDSAVSLLRSGAEREKRPLRNLEEWERQVREAFALCVPTPEAEERQRAARGATDRKGWGGAAGGGEAAGGEKKSLRASIEARQRLKAEKRKKGNSNASHPGLSPSGKRWVKKSKMNAGGAGGAKRKEGGGGGGGGGEAKKQKK